MGAAWRVEGENFFLEVQIPPNSRACVVLPGVQGTTEVSSGRYTFHCVYIEPEWPPKPNYRAFYRNARDDDEIEVSRCVRFNNLMIKLGYIKFSKLSK